MEGLELSVFKIIASVGTARSMYINAIDEAEKGNISEAENLIQQGREIANEGHKEHANLLKDFANGEKVEMNLLLVHAEDQLMSTEMCEIFALKIIQLYKEIEK